MRLLLPFLMCLLAMGAAPALAERRVALVIGNEAYENLPALEKANADAKTYADLFEEQGFDQVVFKLDVTRQGMDEAVAEFVDAIEPGDTAVFVYAGHGWSDGSQNYLIGVDAPAKGSESFLRRISLPIENGADGVLDEITAKGATLKIAIIDACRDNPFSSTDGTRSIGMDRGFNRMTAPPQGTFAVFSAGAGQTALDRMSDSDPNPNGVFTRIFVPFLKANMTLLDATKAAQAQVYELARSVGHEQQPAFYDETRGNSVCLSGQCVQGGAASTTVATATPAPTIGGLEEQFWIAVRESDSADLLQSYLDKYPDGQFAEIARVKIAALQTVAHAATENTLGLREADFLDINAVLIDAKLMDAGSAYRYSVNREAVAAYQTRNKLDDTGYLNLELLKRIRTQAIEVRDRWESKALGDDTTKKLRALRALQDMSLYPLRADNGAYKEPDTDFGELEREAIRKYQESIDNQELGDRIDGVALAKLMSITPTTYDYVSAHDIIGYYYSSEFQDWGLIRDGELCFFMTIATERSDDIAIVPPALSLKFEDVTKEGNNYTWRLWMNAAFIGYRRNDWKLSVDGQHVIDGMEYFPWNNISQEEHVISRLRAGNEAVVEYHSTYTNKMETARYSLKGFSRAYQTAKDDCVFGR